MSESTNVLGLNREKCVEILKNVIDAAILKGKFERKQAALLTLTLICLKDPSKAPESAKFDNDEAFKNMFKTIDSIFTSGGVCSGQDALYLEEVETYVNNNLLVGNKDGGNDKGKSREEPID